MPLSGFRERNTLDAARGDGYTAPSSSRPGLAADGQGRKGSDFIAGMFGSRLGGCSASPTRTAAILFLGYSCAVFMCG